jgi:hypothetical protein
MSGINEINIKLGSRQSGRKRLNLENIPQVDSLLNRSESESDKDNDEMSIGHEVRSRGSL